MFEEVNEVTRGLISSPHDSPTRSNNKKCESNGMLNMGLVNLNDSFDHNSVNNPMNNMFASPIPTPKVHNIHNNMDTENFFQQN